ncbi:hypothetical protein ABLN64_19100, partial [Mycobacterium tuberculosis]
MIASAASRAQRVTAIGTSVDLGDHALEAADEKRESVSLDKCEKLTRVWKSSGKTPKQTERCI